MLQHQPLYVLFAGTLSLGLFLMVAGPALRRSRVDMATRLRRLDPDIWRAELAESLPAVGFESGLRPVLRDATRVWERLLQTLHLDGPSSLQRQLQLVAPNETPASFYVEKAKLALIFVAFVLVINLFLDLLHQLARHGRRVGRIVVLVLDNGSAQTSHRAEAALRAQVPQVVVCWLPRYSSGVRHSADHPCS